LPDHRIEVEGQGIPVFEPGSPSFTQLQQTWDNWHRLIRKYARKTGIPPSYILAIATKETGLWAKNKEKQANIGSSAGAQGIMQVMPCRIFEHGRFKDLVCNRDRTDPSSSFDMGSTLLKAHLDNYGGFPAAASAYNAGGLKCYTGPTSNPAVKPNAFNWMNEHDYAGMATKFNNSAIQFLGVNAPSMWPWVIGGGLVATAGLFVVSTKLPQPQR